MDAPPTQKLSARETKFVEAYDGNGTAAARAAGYAGADNVLAVQAGRLLRKAHVKAAIDARTAKAVTPLIASRQERQKFWTEVMQGAAQDMAHRLKASELLGRSEADFMERIGGADGGALQVVVNVLGPGDDE